MGVQHNSMSSQAGRRILQCLESTMLASAHQSTVDFVRLKGSPFFSSCLCTANAGSIRIRIRSQSCSSTMHQSCRLSDVGKFNGSRKLVAGLVSADKPQAVPGDSSTRSWHLQCAHIRLIRDKRHLPLPMRKRQHSCKARKVEEPGSELKRQSISQ